MNLFHAILKISFCIFVVVSISQVIGGLKIGKFGKIGHC